MAPAHQIHIHQISYEIQEITMRKIVTEKDLSRVIRMKNTVKFIKKESKGRYQREKEFLSAVAKIWGTKAVKRPLPPKHCWSPWASPIWAPINADLKQLTYTW